MRETDSIEWKGLSVELDAIMLYPENGDEDKLAEHFRSALEEKIESMPWVDVEDIDVKCSGRWVADE